MEGKLSLRKKSKNDVSVVHLEIACRHVAELKNAGMTENLAIRTLELIADVYAKLKCGGAAVPFHVNDIELWSVEALELKARLGANLVPKLHLRVEHGTPRREFARKIMALYANRRLSKRNVDSLVKQFWKVAVITLEEDRKLLRWKREFTSPYERWAAAGITFPIED